jgi:hypothetical protein
MIVRTLQGWWQAWRGYHVPMDAPITITHRPDQQCFEAVVDGHRCVADYRLDGSLMHMNHTFVHPALESRAALGTSPGLQGEPLVQLRAGVHQAPRAMAGIAALIHQSLPKLGERGPYSKPLT